MNFSYILDGGHSFQSKIAMLERDIERRYSFFLIIKNYSIALFVCIYTVTMSLAFVSKMSTCMYTDKRVIYQGKGHIRCELMSWKKN